MVKAEETMMVMKVSATISGKLIWVVKFIPKAPEKGAVKFALLTEVEFVVMLKVSSGSLCPNSSVEFKRIELEFMVELFSFKNTHVFCASTDPITSVVCR